MGKHFQAESTVKGNIILFLNTFCFPITVVLIYLPSSQYSETLLCVML